MITGLGVGIPPLHGEIDDVYEAACVATLRPAWWYDWRYKSTRYIFPPYLPMVWAMRMDDAANRAMIASRYGPRLWLLGNIDKIGGELSSLTTPQQAADMSRWWHDAASGTFACPGVLLNQTAAPLDWLDAYLRAGGVVPEAWHVHNYAWVEAQWDGNLTPFLLWMQRRGVQRPVIVSECASWDQSLPAQQAIMDRVATVLEQGNIQAACWYSSHDPFGVFVAADLLHSDGSLSALGEHYLQVTGQGAPHDAGLDVQVHLPVLMG